MTPTPKCEVCGHPLGGPEGQHDCVIRLKQSPTPRPYSFRVANSRGDTLLIGPDNHAVAKLFSTVNEKQALQILQAVNHHEALVEALTGCFSEMKRVIQSNRDEGNNLPVHERYQRMLKKAEALLAKVKAKEKSHV